MDGSYNNSSTTTNSHIVSNSEQFDSLRREATKLERNLEDKISRYHHLAQKIHVESSSPSRAASGSSGGNLTQRTGRTSLEAAEQGMSAASTATPNKNTSSKKEESALAHDINRTLSALNDLINSRMAPAADKSNKPQHALLVKRYREILFDSTNDFQKTSGNIHRQRESMELFSGANGNGGSEENPAMEQLLRERNAIGNSMKSATSVLGQATDIRNDLKNQGMALRGVGGKILVMANQIPGLNGLIDNIRRRRGQDDMVVSGSIAACILFTLWYMFG